MHYQRETEEDDRQRFEQILSAWKAEITRRSSAEIPMNTETRRLSKEVYEAISNARNMVEVEHLDQRYHGLYRAEQDRIREKS